MLRCLFALLVALAACNPPTEDTKRGTESAAPVDEDGDGYIPSEGDCDDSDPTVNPGELEICDGNDNDCDDQIDEDVSSTWYADADGDGFGDAVGTPVQACAAPEGHVANGTDCDDTDADTFPGATEYCDGADDDCDAAIDEDDAEDAAAWHADLDADEFGDADVEVIACYAPDGYVADATDCDDTVAETFPGADEICDGEDDDCDGDIDEDEAVDALTWYADADGDTFGDAGTSAIACEAPAGTVADATDCDDTDAATFPGATEYCDGADDDCDGTIDEDDAADADTWFADTDGDTYGDSAATTVSCAAPSGSVAVAGDCDDTDAATFPGATELCDGEDDDCDGVTDEADAADASTWYVDADSDTYGEASTATNACEAPAGYVADATDCDDAAAGINPGAVETCDGEDDDCDGVTDEDDASDAATWYADLDADDRGDASAPTVSCEAPAGYVADATDCDDTDADVYPGATEHCDGEDDDCDGTTDEDDAVDATTWYADLDRDTYGDASTSDVSCTAPARYVADSSDCDDTDTGVHPGATEYCDGEDDDCDGTVDESSAADASTWYRDGDGDSYGLVTTTTLGCSQPSGYVSDASDCDDGDAGTNPGADEYCDGEDDDCDGTIDEDAAVDATTWYRDADRDSYGTSTTTDVSCTAPSGYVAISTDCDDTDAGVYPGAPETCDGEDDNCDGTVDGGASSAPTWYLDADSDGYGVTSTTTESCTAPTGYASVSGDCDDTDADISPADAEVCDGVDNDCDSTTDESSATDASTWYRDADGDGYGTSGTTQDACTQPSGYVSDSTDCNDSNASYNPGETEVCSNSVDEDCDGTADDGCPTYETHCGTISASETWSAADVHLVTCDVYVQGSSAPTLTIEDGAEVLFSTGTGLLIGSSSYGSLTIAGSTNGVVLTSSATSPSAGAWDGITVGPYNRGTTITNATIEYGGANNYGNVYASTSAYSAGSLVISGCQITDSSNSGVYLNSESELDMSETTVSGNADYGVYLSSSSDLETTGGPTFTDNTLTDNDLYPIQLPATYVGQLDATSSFTGNGTDRIYVTGATLTSDATWQDLDADYLIASDVAVAGGSAPTLTIEDGATLRFATGIGLTVGSGNYGGLDVQGTTTGVTFTASSSAPSAGDWDGLYFGANTRVATVDGATIEYGGANGYGNVYAYYLTNSSTTLTITDSVIRESSNSGVYVGYSSGAAIRGTEISDNTDYGLWLEPTASLDGDFTDNVVTGNVLNPVNVPADYVDELDATSTYTGNGTDLVRVTTDTVVTDATWQLLDVDHLVVGDVYVQASTDPTLTISDGLTLYFNPGIGLLAGYTGYGSLDIQGTTTGVTLTSSDTSAPAAGDWDGVWIGRYDTGSRIDGATIAYGGANTYANVYVTYNSSYSTRMLITDSWITASSNSGVYLATNAVAEISGTVIDENAEYGVYVDSSSALASTGAASFANNEVSGNGNEPVRINADQMRELDDSSTYTGNTTDRIYVVGETVSSDSTWQALDVPWYVSTDITFQGSTSPELTIEAGVELEFARSAGLLVGNGTTASLYAVGTAASPIVFTSAQSSPAAGDWDGITIGNYDVGSTIQYATVEYGGANAKGNIYFYYADPGSMVDSCTIAYSSYYGIYRTSSTPTLSNITYTSNTSGTVF